MNIAMGYALLLEGKLHVVANKGKRFTTEGHRGGTEFHREKKTKGLTMKEKI